MTPPSIRRQLTRRLLLVLSLLLCAGLAAIWLATRSALAREFDRALAARAAAVATLVEQDGDRLFLDSTNPLLGGFAHNPRGDFFEIWRADGTVAARSPSLAGGDLPRTAGTFERPRFFNLTLPNGEDGRLIGFAFTPENARDERRPAGAPVSTLVVAVNRERLDEKFLELIAIVGAVGALLLGATLLVVPRVLRRGLQPLDQLADQAARIDAETLSTRFPIESLPMELRPIGGRLNDLLCRLEGSFERERRFSADLAHELRTPLAELSTLAECALKWPETRDEAAYRDTLAIARQMESLVITMLALARGDRGQLAGHPEPTDLATLIPEIWNPFTARAAARGLGSSVAVNPAPVTADRTMLRSILANLFDNAVDYAPAGGEIAISVDSRGPALVVTVANTVENLNPEDLDRFFDRFWRKEAARTGGRHFGLGLPLARTFASVMGWELTARLDRPGWLVLTLKAPFPRAGVA